MGARDLETRQFDSGKWNPALLGGWHRDQLNYGSHARMLGWEKRGTAAIARDNMRSDVPDSHAASIFGYLFGDGRWFTAHGPGRAGENGCTLSAGSACLGWTQSCI